MKQLPNIFKIYKWVFSGLVENSSYWYLDVVGSTPTTVDITFLSCARSPNLLSSFGKMSTDFWWQGVLHIELALKILVYVLCTRVEGDNRRARHKQYTRTHIRIFLKIVKLRIIYFWYTLLYSQNLIWPQNSILIVDVTMSKTFV